MTSKLMEDMIDEFLNNEEKGYYIEMAKRMLKDNMDIENVCKYTNLSFEEVTDIINKLNAEENNK
jgi:predicted transposase YdaD